MRNRYLEVLLLTFILVFINYVFSKRIAKPKPENFKPPRTSKKARSSPLYFISEDLCFLSVTFTFFFLNDLMHLIKGNQEISHEIREISPYILWFLLLFTASYAGCLHLNRKIDCIKWQLSSSTRNNIARLKYWTCILGTLLISISVTTATFIFTFKITLKAF
jgi:hypothetical protein